MAAAGHSEPLWLSQVCRCLLSHPAESASLGPLACGLPGSSVSEALQAGALHGAAMPSSCCDLQATPASLRFEAEQAGVAPTRLASVAPQVAPAGPRWVDVGLGQQTRPPVPSGWLGGGFCWPPAVGVREWVSGPCPSVSSFTPQSSETNQDSCAQSTVRGASGHSLEIIRKP